MDEKPANALMPGADSLVECACEQRLRWAPAASDWRSRSRRCAADTDAPRWLQDTGKIETTTRRLEGMPFNAVDAEREKARRSFMSGRRRSSRLPGNDDTLDLLKQ